MTLKKLVVAALLLTSLASNAAAADNNEHPSPNAQKLIATLNSLGINNKEIQEFIEDAHTHVYDGYINFAEEDVLDGKLALRFPLNSDGNQPRRLELNYTPDDSHMQYTARSSSVMVHYRFKF